MLRSVSLSMRVIFLVLVLLIGLAACGDSPSSLHSGATSVSPRTPTASVTPTPTPKPAVDRHGLPVDVPLPEGAIFDSQGQYLPFNVGSVHLPQISIGCYSSPTNQTWVWTTSSPNTPSVLQQFYERQLPAQGWSHLLTSASCNGGNPMVVACGNGGNKQIVMVQFGATITQTDASRNPIGSARAPAGGAALGIAVMTAQPGRTDPTLGVYLPGSADIFCS